MTSAVQPTHAGGYETFFGLREAPFSLAPDPRFLFASASHSAALGEVFHALERREPLVVITGEVGTGKTLLCRTVLQRFVRKTFVSVVNDPLLERDELLKQLLEDFGVISKDRSRLGPTSRHDLIDALQSFLLSLVPIQAHAVVVIDEAQHLQPDVIEQIRLLSNVDDQHGTLLQIVLVGQTELDALLARPELRQMQQRVSRRFRIEPLNRDEVRQYIEHRLALARGDTSPSAMPGAADLAQALADWRGEGDDDGVEFTTDAIDAILELSNGLPRVVNLLCDRSLEGAYAARVRRVDASMVRASARALGVGRDEPFWGVHSEPPPPQKVSRPADEPAIPAAFTADATWGSGPSLTRYAVLAAALGVAVAAIWIGTRAMATLSAPATTSQAPSPATSSQAPGPTAPAAHGAPSPTAPAAVASTPPAAAGSTAPTPRASAPPAQTGSSAPSPAAHVAPSTTAPATPTPAAAPDAAQFDIVVASFRTEARAVAVAAEVSAAGLPTRRRTADAWQQVVVGPFASRSAAEAAQQRLQTSGFGGSQIVAALR